jgi:Alkylmercury lyase
VSDLIEVCRSARLTPAAYQFYRAVLLSFAEREGAPDQAHLRELASRFGVPLAATLAECAAKGLLQRDPTTGAIQVAYPFSGVPTAHRVTLGVLGVTRTTGAGDARSDRDRQPIFAMCALDALGIPLMLRRDALVASQDALTGEPVAVQVRVTDAAALTGAMGWEARWTPASTVVYARAPEHEHEHECGVDAASACCPVINFFTTEAHAQAWAETHPVADGVLLTQVEAMRYAHANFGGLLDRL